MILFELDTTVTRHSVKWFQSLEAAMSQTASKMERIHVTVGPRTIDFRPSMTVKAVEDKIRTGFVLQGGWLELDNLVLAEDDVFADGRTYNFVGGISPGK